MESGTVLVLGSGEMDLDENDSENQGADRWLRFWPEGEVWFLDKIRHELP